MDVNYCTETVIIMKKSQIKMIESIFVIIIFMIIFVIVIVFLSRFQRSESDFQRTEASLQKSIELAQIFSSLPEISCTEGSTFVENCVDILKLESFNNMASSDVIYYFDLFRYGTITVRKFYPEPENEREWVLYDVQKPGSGFFSMGIPMAIYDPITRRTYFGIMDVVYYDT